MSLYGSDEKYTYGAIRNAQLRPLIFPEWTIRIYVERPYEDGLTHFPHVPKMVLSKLEDLGVQLYYVDYNATGIPPKMWRNFVADDEAVDWFIVRDADNRLTERDAKLVSMWMTSRSPLHCIRDHPSHISKPLMNGLWGGRPKDIHSIIKTSLTNLMKESSKGSDFLSNTLWPLIHKFSFCHDSFSCEKYPNSHPINITRNGFEHVGQIFDAYGEVRDTDTNILKNAKPAELCVKKETSKNKTVKH